MCMNQFIRKLIKAIEIRLLNSNLADGIVDLKSNVWVKRVDNE